MKLKLILAKGKPKGKEIAIDQQPSVIGRDPQCEVVIGSGKVSRKHCRIEIEGDKAFVVDEGSRNGTFVNGQKVEGRRALKAGDKVVVGPMGFIVQIDGSRGAGGPAAGEPAGSDLDDFLASLEQEGDSAAADEDDVLKLTDDDQL